MRKSLCLLLAVFVLAILPATAQFHHNTGPVVWTWPTPVDANSPENQQKLKDVIAWLKKHGTPGSYALAFQIFAGCCVLAAVIVTVIPGRERSREAVPAA